MARTIVVTGASDGIGAAAVGRLHGLGHEPVVVGRDERRTRAVADRIGARWFTADFARLEQVQQLAADLLGALPRIDALANNAGGVFGARTVTADGFERTLQVDHLAPFLLTRLLLPRLLESSAAVVQTSSVAARFYGRLDLDDLGNARRYTADKAYGDAKLANQLMTVELQRRYPALAVAAFHPGFIGSGFASDTSSLRMRAVYNPLTRRFLTTPERGAEQLVRLTATPPGPDWPRGAYLERGRPARRENPQARDAALAAGLWEASVDAVRPYLEPRPADPGTPRVDASPSSH